MEDICHFNNSNPDRTKQIIDRLRNNFKTKQVEILLLGSQNKRNLGYTYFEIEVKLRHHEVHHMARCWQKLWCWVKIKLMKLRKNLNIINSILREIKK